MRLMTFITLIGTIVSLGSCRQPDAPLPLQHMAYVWQRAWTNDVTDAVARADDTLAGLMVLAGELTVERGHGRMTVVSVDWAALAHGARVIPVIRANVSLDTLLDTANAPRVAATLADFYRDTAAYAAASGLTLTELQLDYDCPTSKLSRYTGFLHRIRDALPNVTLSITALPTWLGDAALPDLVRNTDEWVLQVHSFEAPTHLSDDLTVCRVDQVQRYLTQAAELGIPFHLALPTYGYDVVFDAEGAFAALAAEGGVRDWPEDYTVRSVRSDPVAMARIVADLSVTRPACLRGITWFRLPVATDARNWSWPVLESVTKGQAPTPTVTAEIRYPRPGLAEVWVEGNPAGITIRVVVPAEYVRAVASDTFRGFTREAAPDGTVVLTGQLADDSDKSLIAWFRMPKKVSLPDTPLEVLCTL